MRATLHVRVPVLAASIVVVLACAGPIVRPGQLPMPPDAPGSIAHGTIALALVGAPAAMADEVRQIVGPMGAREAPLPLAQELAAACKTRADVVVRPRLGRTHFASNAPDRNTLFIYETAIVVGIPVTLVSAVAWPWYGETIVDGELEVLRCSDSGRLSHREVFRIRSEGLGFVRTATIRDTQRDAALRGLARRLMARFISYPIPQESYKNAR